MDNLRFPDFLVVRRHVIYVALCLLAITAGALRAEERAGSTEPLTLAQQTGESEPTATVTMQKIQRLLKLLASRYPERYGSVDPGRLDGVFGEETKLALRNFRAIAGLVKDPKPDTQLTADILSELALMSANESTSAPVLGGVDCVATPDSAACGNARSANPTAALPAAGEPKSGGMPARDIGPAKPDKEAAIPEAPAAPAAETEAEADAAKPAEGKLYFVQAASLRSLESAQQEWARIKEANRVALHEEKVQFERADLKDRGIYYRILIGPQPDRDAAKALCSALKENDRSCVVTSRSAADVRGQVEEKKEAGRPDSTDDGRKLKGVAPPPVPRSAAPANPALPPVAGTTVAPSPGGSMHGGVTTATPNPAPAAPAAGTTGPATAEVPPSAAQTIPTPAIPAPAASARPAPQTEQQAAVPTMPPMVETRDQAAAAKPGVQPAETANSDRQPTNPGFVGQVLAAGRELAAGFQDIRVIAVLAVLLMAAAVFYHKYRRIRRRAFSDALAATGLPIAGITEGEPQSGQTIATLEEDFESEQLRDSRRVRDEFLHRVLDVDAENQSGIENGDSAIRINGSLKDLLAADPAQYKSIFLNLIFLSKLGAALNRKEIALDQLNEQIGRELELLRAYFKIHLLELDDRHRIRRELPGLFYCLQLSQRQMKPQSVRFSAA